MQVNWTIQTLDLGIVELDASRTVQNARPGNPVEAPIKSFLLRSKTTNILVDTGFRSPEVLARIGMRAVQNEGQTVERELLRLGLSISGIDMVVQTHLHIDHAGQTDLFPMSTPVVLDRRELEYSVSGLSGASYPPEDVKHIIDRLHVPGSLRLLDLELTGGELLLPGIRCLPAGGHTPGSLMVMVETADGLACLCGDIIYNMKAQLGAPTVLLGDPTTSGNYVNARREEKASIKRALNSGAKFLYPSHDKPGRIADATLVEFDLELP
jgi:glyoxylase-like metal-dependent hydrolase (beta-lactamase superfamily II)